MFETPLQLEGQQEITVNGEPVQATCGPIRSEAANEFGAAEVWRRSIFGLRAALFADKGVVVEIDGVDWIVEGVVEYGESVSMTYVRYLR